MRLRLLLGGGLAAAALVVACAATDSGAETSESDYTRTGGVLGQAPALKLGRSAGGTITTGQLDAYAIELKLGDKITIVETITKGTLTPDFGLFAGGSSYLASASHEALPKKLTKTYVAAYGGRHYLGVAAYQGRGTGNYRVKVTCTGGPCAGEPVIVQLEDGQKNDCIKKTRECALTKARPATAGTNVTLAKARAAWAECLETSSLPDGASCKPACDEGDAKLTCEGIVKAIPFFASRAQACTTTLLDCMSSCIDAGDHSDISEQICMMDGFNGTCDGFARENKACGGSVLPGSNEECHELCHSTSGAWMDDLDTICEEACP